MNDKKDSELIRGDQLQAFNLWDIPSFDEAPHQVSRDADQPEVLEAEPVVEDVEELPEVKPFTVEELEQIRAEAYNEGFATGERDGFHSGQLKAQQEAKTRIEARVDELGALMAQLFEPLQQQDDQIEDMLLTLVESMVRQVIQRELQTDSSQIVQVLRGALKVLPMGANNIRIYLNPADFEAVKRLRERHEESWRLLEDDQLLPGGCRVETEHSQVDATRETRLQQVIEQLYEQQREQRAHPPAPDLPIPALSDEAGDDQA
ncbi:flagellar assembly protein H [Pseudomonas saudimassiliensis]|uniref:Flagellar assembly protein FliH n=1 Tax=Pseudomonas saudimassiliensis TaxID=1461581 RepID=A0A078MIC4_9PSED|nr:flagellar assembly protein FliH [Pseudomonas saudimassiliensis]CEA06045.1 flagellar assembly protein H [Pseudomonas saudimassiliensis]CEF27470.1 flagellar assembly protein H [Pseudomonas saudimassiliensis]